MSSRRNTDPRFFNRTKRLKRFDSLNANVTDMFYSHVQYTKPELRTWPCSEPSQHNVRQLNLKDYSTLEKNRHKTTSPLHSCYNKTMANFPTRTRTILIEKVLKRRKQMKSETTNTSRHYKKNEEYNPLQSTTPDSALFEFSSPLFSDSLSLLAALIF